MSKHTPGPWQGGDGAQTTRLWAHHPLGSVIIADFSVSKNLRHEEQVANCRRARVSARLAGEISIEELERLLKEGLTIGKLLAEIKGLRSFKASVDESLNSGDGSYRP